MLTQKKLHDFCVLALKIGVNLQKGQPLEIVCPIEKAYVAHEMSKTAFSLGAKDVSIRYEDEIADKIRFLGADKEQLSLIPKWIVLQKENLVKQNYCYVAIASEDPYAFKDVPADKIASYSIAKGKALKKFSDCVMANGIRWCVVSVPTENWAKTVFPNSENAQELLSEAIEKTMRLDKDDPLKEWEQHIKTLNNRAKFLNEQNFDYLYYKNSKGTDLKVGLADNHLWLSAKETAKDGIPFVANMPTEEVFTAPHRLKTEGVLKSALPLCYNGQIIDDFSITFKKGKIVNFSAKKGYDILKELINTDKGTFRLGEVALIGKNSPIAKSGILYYNTLFDENASCHLAIGKSYPTTIKNGDKLSNKELLSLGANDSTEHVDFMIGTSDLFIDGVKKDGTVCPLFRDGEWVI